MLYNCGMKKNIDIFFKILFITCLFVFIYFLLNIVKWDKENRKNKKLDNDIKTNTTIIEKNNFDNTVFVNPDHNKNGSYWYYAGMKIIDVDLNNLRQLNNDVSGWIQVPGTNIDYPFVKAKNNKYYLNHSIDKSYNDAGWIFLDYRNDYKLDNKNNILYGHARRDGTMFGSLKNVLKKTWFTNKDNHVIKISTPYENSLWQIFSVYYIETESYYITVNFKDKSDYLEYINTSLERSIYKFDSNVNGEDTILTLSTCHGEKKKLVVQAKLIKKEIKSS